LLDLPSGFAWGYEDRTMTPTKKYLLLAALIVLIPSGAAVGWWCYWPRYQLSQAEQAVAAGDWERAVELLKHLTRTNPPPLRAQLLYAQALRHTGRPAEAQAALHKAMKLGLSESEGRREFALAETLKDFSPNAEWNLLEVLKERPDDVEILQALAAGYTKSQRWDDADTYYTRCVQLRPGDLDVLYARALSRLAALGYYKGRAQSAAADFRAVLQQLPDHFDARLYLAHCLLTDADIPAAQRELTICAQRQPTRLEPLVGLAACAVEERRYSDTQRFLERALEIDKDSTYVLAMFGDLHLRQLQFDQAIPIYEKVLRLDARHRGARIKLAQCLRARGEAAKADEQERVLRELGEDKRPLLFAGGR
jgi:tetratricopeptide (TPR) repeat protein